MNQSGVRSGRLLSILLLLQARRTATARELAAHLGVSMRTVYRDVEVLSQMGVPLYAENGRGGGYRLVDGYRTTLTGLTSQESLALFLIGLPAPAASLGLTEQARSAEAKLLAALGPHHEERANRLRDRFLLDLPAWYSYATTPAALPALADALLTNRRVHVSYWRWAEPREVRRTLDPHGLVVKNGVWYLVAADRTRGTTSPLRTYRVSNVLELRTEDVTFERVTPFDLAEFWQHHLTDFDRRRLTATAHIRVAPELVAQLPDLSDSGLADALRHGSRDEQGWVLAELPIESAAKGAVQLIGYGSDIEVVSPPELRTALVALAKAVLKQYANGSGPTLSASP